MARIPTLASLRTPASASQYTPAKLSPATPTERQPEAAKPASSGIPPKASTFEMPDYIDSEFKPVPTNTLSPDVMLLVYERAARREFYRGMYADTLNIAPTDWHYAYGTLDVPSWWRKQPIPFDCKVALAKDLIIVAKQAKQGVPELWETIAKGDAFAESIVAPRADDVKDY